MNPITFSGNTLSLPSQKKTSRAAEKSPHIPHWIERQHEESRADIDSFSTAETKLNYINTRISTVERTQTHFAKRLTDINNTWFPSQSEKERVQTALKHMENWKKDLLDQQKKQTEQP